MKLDSDLLLYLFEDGELDKTDLRLIRAIRDGRCELTLSSIARDAGFARSTVRDHLRKIKAAIERSQL